MDLENNIPKEFKEIYNKLDHNIIEKMDNYRKKTIKSYTILIVFILLFAITFFGANILSDFNLKIAMCGLVFFNFICIIWSIIAANRYEESYVEMLKEEVIPDFIKLINPNMNYDYYGKIGVDSQERNKDILLEYNNAGYDDIVATHINRKAAIENRSVDKPLKIFELDVYQEYINHDGEKSKMKTFEGFFAWLESDIDIKNSLKIYINDNGAKRINKVQMDSIKFEQLFDVQCDDKILSMRILTVEVMEMLIEFYAKYRLGFEVCYKNNRIYIRFFSENLFNPRQSNSISNLYTYFSVFKFSMDLVCEMERSVKDIGL